MFSLFFCMLILDLFVLANFCPVFSVSQSIRFLKCTKLSSSICVEVLVLPMKTYYLCAHLSDFPLEIAHRKMKKAYFSIVTVRFAS